MKSTFVCENCKAGVQGAGRYYPGSGVARQPRMEHICERCERILMDAVATTRAAVEISLRAA